MMTGKHTKKNQRMYAHDGEHNQKKRVQHFMIEQRAKGNGKPRGRTSKEARVHRAERYRGSLQANDVRTPRAAAVRIPMNVTHT
jgi:hypothetical protein